MRAAGRKGTEILGESTESGMTRNLSYRRKEANKRGLTFNDIIREPTQVRAERIARLGRRD